MSSTVILVLVAAALAVGFLVYKMATSRVERTKMLSSTRKYGVAGEKERSQHGHEFAVPLVGVNV